MLSSPDVAYLRALRQVLAARALIVLAAAGTAAFDGWFRNDWTAFRDTYLACDFFFTLIASLDVIRTGWSALLAHWCAFLLWHMLAVVFLFRLADGGLIGGV